MPPVHSKVSANGIDVHYVREGSGLPLVFLHGWPEFWRTWRRNLTPLSESYDVVAPDLRGFGATEKPDLPAEEGYTVADHVADLRALTTALDLDEFGLVSHDLGALVAQQFAREYPESVTGLFFFDCPYPGIGDRWLRADRLGEIWYQSFNQQPWAADLVGASRETCETYIGHFLSHWAGDPDAFDREDRDAWIDNFMREGNLQGGFNWYVAADDARKRLMREGAPSLPTIDIPTRVLWGELDPVLRVEWADRLDEYFSDCEFDSLPDAGHFAHYERPERANEEIDAFFSSVT
ncbi:alpha/beta fold hydrolase [Halomarina salina]|uniref:Alpha/beta fold hydrolase n=1 Tax=Halomarina salina TaxID=1872699 RepID=A0ABD5RSL1_9EURY